MALVKKTIELDQDQINRIKTALKGAGSFDFEEV